MSQVKFESVLITGTTSGIGRALLAYYHRHGARVIAVNRRECRDLWAEFPGIELVTLDISDKNAVHKFLGTLVFEKRCPQLFILNAGINRPDNFEGLEFDTFQKVMSTNLYGVFSFLGAAHDLGLRGKTFAALSSTSNIIPNPAHVGYYLSKSAIHEGFRLLRRKDVSNRYKTIVLGPVKTNIMAGYPGPQGIQRKIFDLLAVTSEETAEAAARFFESSRETLVYPRKAWAFYESVGALLSFFPRLYQGSQRLEA